MIPYYMAKEQEPPRYKVLPRPVGNNGGRKARYVNVIGGFDVETSTIYDDDGNPHSFMYLWQFAIEDRAYCGRTWDEFKVFLGILEDKVPKGATMLVFDFNLSFEYQFLAGVFDIDRESIFATEPRRILKLNLTPFVEFRCAYFLSNMTLRKFLQAEGVERQKEELDYKEIRYPWTPLKADELSYAEADVIGLVQAIKSRMKRTGDNVYTIPYTATGYVRREAKDVMKSIHWQYTYDDYDVFKLLHRAFRGGNTHASRYWAAYGVVRERVLSDDISSSYPYIIMSGKFPVEPFKMLNPAVAAYNGGLRYIEDLMRGLYAVIFKVSFEDIEVDDAQHVPYIPLDKCDSAINGSVDNGRILNAEHVTITITDVDYEIIKSQYTWSSAKVLALAVSKYGRLPQEYIDLTRSYFDRKTRLKGVDKYMYSRNKELLNSLYGMMAQNPLRMEIEYDEDKVLCKETPKDPEAQYIKGCKRAFMPYSWAVWLTAQARQRLQAAIDMCGGNFLYCDTDSVKHLGEYDFSVLGGDDIPYYDAKGKPHYCGVWERDAIYSEFATMGAKKYVVRYSDDDINGDDAGKLEITIAGVGKIEGTKELEAKGGIDAFKKGLVFRSGGIDAVYNDLDNFTIMRDNKAIHITRNVSLVDGTYTLGVSDAYGKLLEAIQNGREVVNPFTL